MLSHDNVTWTSRIGAEQYSWDQERILSYLPLSHIAGIMEDIFITIYAANEIHFADKEVLKTTLVDNLKRVKPTRLGGVPRVFEKIAEKMQEAGKKNIGLKKVFFFLLVLRFKYQISLFQVYSIYSTKNFLSRLAHIES